MKQFYLILTFTLLTTQFSYGQWVTTGNNIYYPDDKVGIGKDNTYYDLKVHNSFVLSFLIVLAMRSR